MAIRTGRAIKINGVTVIPNWDWSADFRKHYGAYFRDNNGGKPDFSRIDYSGGYWAWLQKQCASEDEAKGRFERQYELAERPNVLSAVHLVRSETHSTPGVTVYTKQSAFNMISAAVR